VLTIVFVEEVQEDEEEEEKDEADDDVQRQGEDGEDGRGIRNKCITPVHERSRESSSHHKSIGLV
jgi:hypothetical protein